VICAGVSTEFAFCRYEAFGTKINVGVLLPKKSSVASQ